jgi:hypothetical protein
MKVMARACGHHHFKQFHLRDLSTWKKTMADLAHIPFGGDPE